MISSLVHNQFKPPNKKEDLMIIFIDTFRSNMFPDGSGIFEYECLTTESLGEFLVRKNFAICYSALDVADRAPGENERFTRLERALCLGPITEIGSADFHNGDSFVMIPMDPETRTAQFVHVWCDRETADQKPINLHDREPRFELRNDEWEELLGLDFTEQQKRLIIAFRENDNRELDRITVTGFAEAEGKTLSSLVTRFKNICRDNAIPKKQYVLKRRQVTRNGMRAVFYRLCALDG